MPTSAEDLRIIALAEFATAGYAGTSLHRIADLAGLSKSSVLYHYSSKETLLEAAVAPAIDRIAELLDEIEGQRPGDVARGAFIEDFVDFLLRFRREVHLFINQGASLVDVPVIDRANGMVARLAEYFDATTGSLEEKVRFGVALGGAAYLLSGQDHGPELPAEQLRPALIAVLTSLLAPEAAAISEKGD